jgi:hypothetical protein
LGFGFFFFFFGFFLKKFFNLGAFSYWGVAGVGWARLVWPLVLFTFGGACTLGLFPPGVILDLFFSPGPPCFLPTKKRHSRRPLVKNSCQMMSAATFFGLKGPKAAFFWARFPRFGGCAIPARAVFFQFLGIFYKK